MRRPAIPAYHLARWPLLAGALGLVLGWGGEGGAEPAGRRVEKTSGATVEIPGGTFPMGSESREASESERPIHKVTVQSFRLDLTEVTVNAYAECVRQGVCSAPEAFRKQRADYRIFCNWKHPQDRALHPVNCVDFYQAASYCSWAGKRLPSEAEWEYAAAGGAEARIFPWGNSKPSEKRLNACGPECPANLAAKGFPRQPRLYEASDGWPETAPVGSFPEGASKDGVLDLAGNVWEWTASEYASYDGRRREGNCVLRGGSWGGGDARTERTTNRFRLPPESKGQFLGFRCAQ